MSDDKELTLAEMENLLQSGGKFWRAWAQAGKVVSGLRAQQAVVDERTRAIAESEVRLTSLNGAIAGAEARLAEVRQEAEAMIAKSQEDARVRAQAAEAEAQQIKGQAEKDAQNALEAADAARTQLAAVNHELSARQAELSEARSTIARAEAVNAALRGGK